MSRHFPVCNAHEVVRVLRRNGFTFVDQRGSHQKWRHPDGRQAIVAQHGSKPIATIASVKLERRLGELAPTELDGIPDRLAERLGI